MILIDIWIDTLEQNFCKQSNFFIDNFSNKINLVKLITSKCLNISF